MKTARVTRLTPEGSTLTRANGVAVVIGAGHVEEGEAVTLATPDGTAGTVTLAPPGVRLTIRTTRLAPPEVVSVDAARSPSSYASPAPLVDV